MPRSTLLLGLTSIIIGFETFILSQHWIFDGVHDVASQRKMETPSLRNAHAASFRKSKLGDGCYHILLDVGSNIGVNARFLYEPHLYPKARSLLNNFDREFGKNRDNRDFCVFAFEPNPAHRQRHENLTKAYEKVGWKYHPMMAGVSDANGTITFYHLNDESHNEWGFSVFQPSNQREGTAYVAEHVPIVRLSQWMWDELWDRQLPETLYGDYSDLEVRGPKIVMKLDVEKMEYVVVPDLLMSGALCNMVNFFYGEFHMWKRGVFPLNFSENNLYLKDHNEGRAFFNSIKWIQSTARNCKTQMDWSHSEEYLYDGMPFPEPQSV